MRRFVKLGRPLSLFSLLIVVLWLAVQQLYVSFLSPYSYGPTAENYQALEALLAIEYPALPHSAVRLGISQRALSGQPEISADKALIVTQNWIRYSPSDALAWYHWLGLTMISGKPYMAGERAAVIEALATLARNEPDYRLRLARMGLRNWYGIDKTERVAFLTHISWVASIAPKVLWGHAKLLNRTQLLCRLNNQHDLGISLCVPNP